MNSPTSESRSEAYAKSAADHALAAYAAVTKLSGEVGKLAVALVDLTHETRENFAKLRETRHALSSLSSEIEDTKSGTVRANLAAAKGEAARWRRMVLGIVAGIAVAVTLRLLHV